MDFEKRISALLLICYDTLDTYGKEPEQLQNASKLFAIVLSDYSIEQIETAFKTYLKRNTDMPKPADIVKIIEPPKPEKKWCKVTFLEIKRKKRENIFTTDEENKYCEDFIKASVSGCPDERLALNEVVQQAAIENKQYWIE